MAPPKLIFLSTLSKQKLEAIGEYLGNDVCQGRQTSDRLLLNLSCWTKGTQRAMFVIFKGALSPNRSTPKLDRMFGDSLILVEFHSCNNTHPQGNIETYLFHTFFGANIINNLFFFQLMMLHQGLTKSDVKFSEDVRKY